MIPDLSQIRMVSLDEVAALFKRKPATIKKAVQEDRFPVRPRERRKGLPLQWSSVDLRRYFEDIPATRGHAAKRGTKEKP